MKCSSCDSGKWGKYTGYWRRWDFYEWVDEFRGPGVNSLSKMIYWTENHLFHVAPQRLFFFFALEKGSGRDIQTPQYPAALLSQESTAGETVRRGVWATTATPGELELGKSLLNSDSLPPSLPRGPAARCPTLRQPPAESDGTKVKKVQVPASLSWSVWSSGNRFGTLEVRAVSVLLLVGVIKRRECMNHVWTQKEVTQTIARI